MPIQWQVGFSGTAGVHPAALEVCDNPFRPLKTEIGTWAGSRYVNSLGLSDYIF